MPEPGETVADARGGADGLGSGVEAFPLEPDGFYFPTPALDECRRRRYERWYVDRAGYRHTAVCADEQHGHAYGRYRCQQQRLGWWSYASEYS